MCEFIFVFEDTSWFIRIHVRNVLENSVIIIMYKREFGSGSSVGIATDYGLDGPGSNPGGDEIFYPSDRPWGPTSLLYNGYRIFPRGKVRPGRAADHSSPSSAAVMEQ